MVAYLLVDCGVQPDQLQHITIRMFYDCYQHKRDRKTGELVRPPAVLDEKAELFALWRRRGLLGWQLEKKWREHLKAAEGRRRG